MSTFVLVHGAWHGAWCWYKLVPALTRAGHRVVAPDLEGLGRDRTPLGQVSLDLWVHGLCSRIEQAGERVILVGHSRGGVVISAVAERMPERVACLAYVTAFLLRDGETVFEIGGTAGTSLVTPNLVVDESNATLTIRDEAVAEVFYGECTLEDVTLARMLLVDEPVAPSTTPLRITPSRFGCVPKIYIECTRDRAIPLDLQRRMAANSSCEIVASLDTDHSPFLSRPRELAANLLALATRAQTHPRDET
jgi:pimeloyl-ACP methyl ester carboxylesterase